MTTPAPLDQGPTTAKFQGLFDAVAGTGITRTPDAPIGGVCGGIAARYGFDATLVRVAVFFGSLVTSSLLYGLAWMLLPDTSGRSHLQRLLQNREFTAGLTGSGLLVLMGLPGWGDSTMGARSNTAWPFVLTAIIAVGVVMWMRRRPPSSARPAAGSTPLSARTPPTTAYASAHEVSGAVGNESAEPRVSLEKAPSDLHATPAPIAPAQFTPAPPVYAPADPPPAPAAVTPAYPAHTPLTTAQRAAAVKRRGPGMRASMAAIGLAALVGGATWAVAAFGLETKYAEVYAWGAAAAVLGIATVLNGLRGRTGGITAALGALAVGGALLTNAGYATNFFTSGSGGESVGDQTHTPPTLMDQNYEVGVGDLRLDLTQAQPVPGDPANITVQSRVGNVEIEIPKNLGIDLSVQNRVGHTKGINADGDLHRLGRTTGAADATIRITSTIGDVIVKEQQ